jgi:hypothetical protein
VALAVFCMPSKAETRVCDQVSPREIFVDKVALGQVFVSLLRFPIERRSPVVNTPIS